MSKLASLFIGLAMTILSSTSWAAIQVDHVCTPAADQPDAPKCSRGSEIKVYSNGGLIYAVPFNRNLTYLIPPLILEDRVLILSGDETIFETFYIGADGNPEVYFGAEDFPKLVDYHVVIGAMA